MSSSTLLYADEARLSKKSPFDSRQFLESLNDLRSGSQIKSDSLEAYRLLKKNYKRHALFLLLEKGIRDNEDDYWGDVSLAALMIEDTYSPQEFTDRVIAMMKTNKHLRYDGEPRFFESKYEEPEDDDRIERAIFMLEDLMSTSPIKKVRQFGATIVWEHFVEDKTYDELAAAFGMSKKHIAIAIKMSDLGDLRKNKPKFFRARNGDPV